MLQNDFMTQLMNQQMHMANMMNQQIGMTNMLHNQIAFDMGHQTAIASHMLGAGMM